jgi:hypothetical protein
MTTLDHEPLQYILDGQRVDEADEEECQHPLKKRYPEDIGKLHESRGREHDQCNRTVQRRNGELRLGNQDFHDWQKQSVRMSYETKY